MNNYQQFKNTVMEHYGEHGRHDLPWRINQSPYYVLVSEIMLQQTQVDRVIPFFNRWMENFPDIQTLAAAKQTDVLRLWKGLGYNSRALRLQKSAQVIVGHYSGVVPENYQLLLDLPGIGPYTAAALMNFAFNTWTPLIETNIRRIFIHHFFSDQVDVADSDLMDMIERVGMYDDARTWVAALMDYGSTLPKIIKHNPNTRSKHYTKQSKFQGSDRQIRGKILDLLLNAKNHRIGIDDLYKQLGDESNRYEKITKQLVSENFITINKKSIKLVE
ncbi:MAG: A/G-specific adenine glycosylase [Minisyncoccia bacterium]